MGELLDRRRADAGLRLKDLRAELASAEKRCSDAACVYVTGSFARGEASLHSDLDLFIVGRGTEEKRELSRLDEILVKADLIEATRRLAFPEFSGDGEYLAHHSLGELCGFLGKPEDDARNTFTARLLLLLESTPLLGEAVYRGVIDDVISAYWKDYQDHKSTFVPAFLANDILRMWRTFCVNYEARTSREPAEKKAKRKLKNYKLKHSRLLTCYSGLLYLLAVFSKTETVSPDDAKEMVARTPTQRLDWILAQPSLGNAHDEIRKLLLHYESFLASTDASENELVQRFLDKKRSQEYFQSASIFGDLVFQVLDAIGRKNRFHRLLVV